MSQNQAPSQFEQVVMVALPPKVEQRFTTAVRKALGAVELVKLEIEDLSNGLPDLTSSLVVLVHGAGDHDGVEELKRLRSRGVDSGVLLLAQGAPSLEAEVDGLGPVGTLSVNGFRRGALANCLRALGTEVEEARKA
ncbi:MAG: hypothetical protein R3190_19010, partial [Thermoanaerobaculia bacterium]|nr:hypothetical protein [Thermoanaerobaculia bacterium]